MMQERVVESHALVDLVTCPSLLNAFGFAKLIMLAAPAVLSTTP